MSKISIIRWDDYGIKIKFTNADWTPVNLTDTTVFFTVKSEYDLTDDNDIQAFIQKDITIHINPLLWETILPLFKTDTSVEAWAYTYDLQLKTADWNIKSTIKGDFVVLQDVTKRN